MPTTFADKLPPPHAVTREFRVNKMTIARSLRDKGHLLRLILMRATPYALQFELQTMK